MNNFLIVALILILMFLCFQIYLLSITLHVINANIIDIVKVLNPNDVTRKIRTLDEYHRWMDEKIGEE